MLPAPAKDAEEPLAAAVITGKITRRILRKIAQNDHDLGDISTLANPGVIKHLFNNRCDTKQ